MLGLGPMPLYKVMWGLYSGIHKVWVWGWASGSRLGSLRVALPLGYLGPRTYGYKWVVLKIMGPLWVWVILRHLIFRVTKMGP